MASAVAENYGLDVILALNESDLPIDPAADDLYETYGSGADSAVILLIDPGRNLMTVKAYGPAAEVFNEIWVDTFLQESELKLQQADYAGVIGDFLLAADSSCRTETEVLNRTGQTSLLSAGDVEIDITQKIYDYASLLTDSEEESLAAAARDILERYQMDMAVVTTADAEGKSSMAYADDFYDYNGFGFGETYDGLLLLVDMENRVVWLSTCGAARPVFTDARIQSITDGAADYLADGNYFGGCSYALEQIESTVRTNREMATPVGRLSRSFRRLPVYLLIAAIISGIAVAVMARQGKTARKARNAAGYLDRSSMRLSVREDRYIRSHTTKTRIEPPSGGGGGGSSSHRSSSGRSHGGGGSRF